MRIAICSNCVEYNDMIRTSIEKYLNGKEGMVFEIATFCKSLDFLDAQDIKTFSVVFIDTSMNGICGTDIAREIKNREYNTEVIFLSDSGEYAVEAFVLGALHYLLKPINDDELHSAIDRAVDRIVHVEKRSIVVKSCGGFVALQVDDIMYIESDSHNIKIFTLKRHISTRVGLNSFLLELDTIAKGQFVAPAKGIIVNLNKITAINKTGITLNNGQVVPISQRLFKKMKELYIEYNAANVVRV